MAHDQISERKEKVEQLLTDAYTYIKNGALPMAVGNLENALSVDFENDEVVSALKCVNFWKERQETQANIKNDFEKGEYFLNHWKLFLSFLERIGTASERCLYALRQFIFGEALRHYRKSLEESGVKDPELLLRIGKCLKRKGDFEQALEFLEAAGQQRREDPEVLAELADCYAMINEERAAKAFFRESFFLNSGHIDLASLESEMIRRLIDKVREEGYSSPELDEWIPVYGTLYGIFTVKRELRSLEYGKLKQSIYALENDLKDQKGNAAVLAPRLINRYFWLIDHYIGSREDRGKIDEVLTKLEKLDSSIYQQYIN